MKNLIPKNMNKIFVPLALIFILSLIHCASPGTITTTRNESNTEFTTQETASEKENLKDLKSVYDVPLDKQFKYLKYLISRSEKRQFRTMDKNSKLRFLQNFWQERDPTPETPENEFLRNYYSRIYLANQSFDEPFTEGWNTDRGRVLILYGSPDDIQRFQNSPDSHPHETWQYYHLNKENNIEFIFVDKHSSGQFELVHSNLRNEITDPGWMRWLDGLENPY